MKKSRRLISLVLCLVLLFSTYITGSVTASAASNTLDIQVIGTFGQTDARNMLTLINNFRTGSDAWYRNPDGSINRSKIGNLQPLQYDYGLEKIAMQRAAEIAVMFEHQRPNGKSIIGTFFDYSSTIAENIAFRQTTPYSALEYWKETNEPYITQGHRRSLLGVDGDYKYVGIGHFVMNGLDYWVQEFSEDPIDTQPTEPDDADTEVPVEILMENISSIEASIPYMELNLEVEDVGELPDGLEARMTFYSHAPDGGMINIKLPYDWRIPDNDFLQRDGLRVTALKNGSTTAVSDTIFNGETAEVIITVTGCEHHYDVEVTREPTCTARGIRQYTCAICGKVKTEYIDMVPHSYVESRIEPTCTQEGSYSKTCSVCGDTISYPIDMIPHSYSEYVVEVEPTCTQVGKKVGVCKTCGRRVAEEIPMIPHTYVETEYPATCQKEGSIEYECSVCHDTYTQTIPKKAHNWVKVSETPPTYDAVGVEIYECTLCGEQIGVDIPKLKKNGWFTEAGGTRYYRNDTYLKYWQEIDGSRYFFSGNGYRLENGRYIIDDKATYYFNAEGVMQKYWQKINGRWYYFDGNGEMKTSWQKISGKWYFFNSSGMMLTGWQKISGKWYYFNSSGAMLTGWQKISGKWYYFNSSGAMLTGWQKISGKWYYFNSSGAMLTGWQKISGKWYYFNAGGDMVTGSKKIGSKTYRFNSSGACLNP